jgi:hypothetical protein
MGEAHRCGLHTGIDGDQAKRFGLHHCVGIGDRLQDVGLHRLGHREGIENLADRFRHLGHPRFEQLRQGGGQAGLAIPQPDTCALSHSAGVHFVVQKVTQIQGIALGVLPKALCAVGVHRAAEDVIDQTGDLRQRKRLQFETFQMLVFPDRSDGVGR